MKRRIIASLALSTSLAACAAKTSREEAAPRPSVRVPVFVSGTGRDEGAGSREDPFRTIERALGVDRATEILLESGTYDAREVTLSRGVALRGPSEGGARLNGHLHVAADGAFIANLDIADGVSIDSANRIAFEAVAVRPGSRDHAVRVVSSSVQLDDVTVACGKETCVDVTHSSLGARGLRLTADKSSKRGLRAETSSVTLQRVSVSGTSINQLQAGAGVRMSVSEGVLSGAMGAGLVALPGATLDVDGIKITDAAQHSILLQGAKARIRRASIGASRATSIGISSGDVVFEDPALEPATESVIAVGQFQDRSTSVRIIGGKIRHGAHSAILVNQGVVTIERTRFIGEAAPAAEGDAILASGVTSVLNVLSAVIETPAGFGVSMTNDASGTISATISRPRTGGVYIENVAVSPIVIRGSVIDRCATGSGIVVQNATDVSVEATRISGCAESGILAGQNASIRVSRGTLTGNAHYGVAAFGGSSIQLEGCKISGSKWAALATCGDGASIEDSGDNKLAGSTALCP